MQTTFNPINPAAQWAATFGPVSRNGTDGRIYGGDRDLLHVRDGERVTVGEQVARYVESLIRNEHNGGDTTRALCPGCFMIVLFNATVTLAVNNGQPLDELGRSMGAAFNALAEGGPKAIEEMQIL